MFETLFTYPKILARHFDALAFAERKRYLAQCACEGMAHATLIGRARDLLVVAERLDVTAGKPFAQLGSKPPLRNGRNICDDRGKPTTGIGHGGGSSRLQPPGLASLDSWHCEIALPASFKAKSTISSPVWELIMAWLNQRSAVGAGRSKPFSGRLHQARC
jgi:hypothetical protein